MRLAIKLTLSLCSTKGITIPPALFVQKHLIAAAGYLLNHFFQSIVMAIDLNWQKAEFSNAITLVRSG